MHLRKLAIAAFMLAALAVPVAAWAATLHNGQGSTCGAGFIGTYHFVNNQTEGASAGSLDAVFTDVTYSGVAPYKVLSKVQMWSLQSEGTLVTASTNLPGKLVLSDFSCTPIKKK